jgi:hypothetical protein
MNDVQRESMMFQRKALGILCMLLVPCCIIFGLFGIPTNPPYWYFSISATFYSNSNIFMIGLLFATTVFFISYKGYDWKDRICALIEGITSFCVIAFPCSTTGAPDKVGLFQLPVNISADIHNISSALLFVTFAFNVLFLFRLSGPEPTEKKKLRNKIYLICGIIICLFMVLQLFVTFANFIPDNIPYTMINEFGMLEAFGFAYFVKSEAISKLND